MKRIDANTVELTSTLEKVAKEHFEMLLDVGLSVVDAVDELRKLDTYNEISSDFYAWLLG